MIDGHYGLISSNGWLALQRWCLLRVCNRIDRFIATVFLGLLASFAWLAIVVILALQSLRSEIFEIKTRPTLTFRSRQWMQAIVERFAFVGCGALMVW